MASSLNNPAWIEWMTNLIGEPSPAQAPKGGVSRHTYAATFPPGLFYCLLDELPLHLLPRRIFKSLQLEDEQQRPLYLNPGCILCADGELPEELASRKELVSGFALQGTVAWVRHPATGNLLPFWLGPQLSSVAKSLRPHDPVPSSLPRDARRLLASAEILIPEDRPAYLGPGLRTGQAAQAASQPLTGSETWSTDLNCDERMAKASSIFCEKGYAPLGDLIHPFHVAALRRYYRYLIRSGAIELGDRQSPRRYVAYNEPVARFFHRDIAATLSVVAGESLKPSYVYMASYLSGAQLKKHTDREQCEFSVTLCLDFSPEPALETPWPIRLDTPSGTVTVYQALGDGLAYRGTRLPHYRDALGDGKTSTSIFFHYVPANFPGSLD
jgi:hypothetical protein